MQQYKLSIRANTARPRANSARETQRGVHTPQSRWIDSICYYAMLGEVLYQEGRNADALAQFDQACQVLLAYPNWLLQVRFQQRRTASPTQIGPAVFRPGDAVSGRS